MLSLKSWSLKSKIVLHLFVIGGLAALLLAFIYIRTQRHLIETMSRQKTELVGSMIENSIFSFMRAGRLEDVQSTLEKISASDGINKIRIFSPEGKILRSSEPLEMGGSIDSRRLGRIRKSLLDRNLSQAILLIDKSSTLGLRVIENRSECFGCHSSQVVVNGILEVDVDYSSAASLLRTNQLKGILIAVVSFSLLIFVILRLFERLISRPVHQLKNKMKEVQEGNLDIGIQARCRDELGTLAESFNIMVSRLREANKKIEKLFNKQMEKAEHLASIGELTAGLAHEIRNPIAGMKGALEIINQKTPASDPQKEIFIEILFQIDKIYNIIQDLLSYARPKELNMSWVNPNECVQDAIKLARPQVNGRDIQFHFTGVGENILALMDANKIQELMLNLILNSIAAISKTGHITVQLEKGAARELKLELKMVIADDGGGIKKEILPQIFNPFFTTKPRGTGLGLSICKKIIEAHEGSVEVISREGQGTTFVIQLPVLQSAD